MGKVATGGGEPRELIPARTYLGVVVGVFDIGTQNGGQFGPNHQFVVMFELHTRKGPARDKKGENFTISEFVNFYLGSRTRQSNLLKLVEALEGRALSDDEIKKGYDIETLLGKACQVQVAHKLNAAGEPKARVAATMPMDPDDVAPVAEAGETYYEIPADKSVPETLPKFIRDMLAKCEELGGKRQLVPAGAAAEEEDDDSIPF